MPHRGRLGSSPRASTTPRWLSLRGFCIQGRALAYRTRTQCAHPGRAVTRPCRIPRRDRHGLALLPSRGPHFPTRPVRLLPHGERTGWPPPRQRRRGGHRLHARRWTPWPAPSTHAASKGAQCHARPESPDAPNIHGHATGREAPRHSAGTAPPTNAYAAPSPPSCRRAGSRAGGAVSPSTRANLGTLGTTITTGRSRADQSTRTHATGARQDDQRTDSRRADDARHAGSTVDALDFATLRPAET